MDVWRFKTGFVRYIVQQVLASGTMDNNGELDISRINDLGWCAKIEIEEGIKDTYEWYIGSVSG